MDTINYFIAESDLPQQTSDQNYGPQNSTQYQVTSTFSGGTNPMAYAVTSGSVIIINQNDNIDRVNLILMPDTLAYGPQTKYFVYRGLLKSDFLDKDNSYVGIRPTDDNDSDFIKKLRKGQSGELALNLYSDLDDGFLIENIFLSDTYQFGLTTQGDSIGRFDSQQDYGFEIMLDEVFFSPTLSDARLNVNVIDLTENPGQEEIMRLKVLNYIDPAAYYGVFSHSQFSVGTNNSTDAKSRKGSDIYKFVQNFYTKNIVYIDVRDNFQNPLDWLENSPETIKITTDGSSALASTEVPYREANGFPIKILNSQFSQSEDDDDEKNYFTLTLSFNTLNNASLPLLTLHGGYWLKSADQIVDDMVFSVCTDNNGWTDDKQFAVFNTEDAQDTVVIASYLRLEFGSYGGLDVFNDQIPNNNNINDVAGLDTDSEDYTGFFTIGMFPYHTDELPDYQEPINE